MSVLQRPAARSRGSLAAAALLALLLLALSAAPVAAGAGSARGATATAAAAPEALTPPVAALADRAPGRRVRVIVQPRPGSDVTAAVRSAGGALERRIELIDALAVRVSAAGAARIAAARGVRAVSLDAPIKTSGLPVANQLATAYNESIRADDAWQRGLTGKGVGVAVIDTGIRGDLADFRVSDADPGSRVIANAVVNPAAGTGDDAFGHGTHIAGLIAGDGTNRPAGDPLRGRYAGVAPEANLIAVKAGDDRGGATVLDVIDGLQFVVDHAQPLGIRVVNLSLSSTVAESHRTDPLDAAVESAWLQGLVVVAAVGNRGTSEDAVSYAPGNDPWVISVGGVDDRGTKRLGDDVLATWSSRGTTQDGHAKPDVLAPGARLVSTIPAGSEYTRLCPTCVVDGEYLRVGGTSMAAALVSGAAALILQAHPDWTPDQVKAALVAEARSVRLAASDGPAGEIQVDKLVKPGAVPPASPTTRPALNDLVVPVTGELDFSRTPWTRTRWSRAVDPLRTSWTQANWMRTSWTRTSWTATPETCTEFERTSWTRTSWTRTSWTDADMVTARAECDLRLASIDPTRTSWTRTSWTRTSWTRALWARTSWTSSFDK